MKMPKGGIAFLEHVITYERLKPNDEKKTTILDMPAHKNKDEVQSLQGTVK